VILLRCFHLLAADVEPEHIQVAPVDTPQGPGVMCQAQALHIVRQREKRDTWS
jgi:hypothetical protein